MRFCQIMKTCEEKGLVKLDPIVFDKNSNEPFKHGICVQCVACHKRRSWTEGNVCLRRPCHIYYYERHLETEAHKEAHNMVESLKKRKEDGKHESHTQSMLHNYFGIKKQRKEPSKNITKTGAELDKSNVNDSSASIVVENLDQHNTNR